MKGLGALGVRVPGPGPGRTFVRTGGRMDGQTEVHSFVWTYGRILSRVLQDIILFGATAQKERRIKLKSFLNLY